MAPRRVPRVTAKAGRAGVDLGAGTAYRTPDVDLTVEWDLGDETAALSYFEEAVQRIKDQIEEAKR